MMRAINAKSLTKENEKDEALYYSIVFGESPLTPEQIIRGHNLGPVKYNPTVGNLMLGIPDLVPNQHSDIAPTNVLYTCARCLADTATEAVEYALKVESLTTAKLRQKLRGFLKLEENWDMEGARRISGETVNTSERVLEHVEIILSRKNTLSSPSVRPSPDGSVTLKWIQGQKELDLTICGQAVEVQRWFPLDAYESEGLLEISIDDTPEQIEWVLTQ